MLTESKHPAAWAMLLYELDDAQEHLRDLVDEMVAAGAIDETQFRIDLGHVYAHLNRAWHGRSDPSLETCSSDLHNEYSRFPADLTPVG